MHTPALQSLPSSSPTLSLGTTCFQELQKQTTFQSLQLLLVPDHFCLDPKNADLYTVAGTKAVDINAWAEVPISAVVNTSLPTCPRACVGPERQVSVEKKMLDRHPLTWNAGEQAQWGLQMPMAALSAAQLP